MSVGSAVMKLDGENTNKFERPADADDLAAFLKALPTDVPVTVLGVGSNVIVRDGGVDGVVIRLAGRAWGGDIPFCVRDGAFTLHQKSVTPACRMMFLST